jgi:adenylosuccinate lyase
MPHKRNPVNCEQICGLARVVRANAQAALENVALWHERDISHSSVERIILPDSAILMDYLLAKTSELVDNMRVFPQRMIRNIEMTHGLIFSGQLLQDLVEHGAPREDAYKWVQSHAMEAWEQDLNFRERIHADANVRRYLNDAALERAFDLRRHVRYVDDIFVRVFGR